MGQKKNPGNRKPTPPSAAQKAAMHRPYFGLDMRKREEADPYCITAEMDPTYHHGRWADDAYGQDTIRDIATDGTDED